MKRLISITLALILTLTLASTFAPTTVQAEEETVVWSDPDLPEDEPIHHTLDTPVLANAVRISYGFNMPEPPLHLTLYNDQGDVVYEVDVNLSLAEWDDEWSAVLPQVYMIGSYKITGGWVLYVTEFSLYHLSLNNPIIQATVDINPNTLNLNSKGKWITAYIELPEGYDVADINIDTVLLDDTVPAEPAPAKIGDYDADGIGDLMVKFDRQEVIEELEWDWGTTYSDEITITLNLDDGTTAEGSDTIKIRSK